MWWYKKIKIREGVGRQCTVMAPKARGSEILLCVGVCSCVYVLLCAHTDTHTLASNQFMCIFDGYESHSGLWWELKERARRWRGYRERMQGERRVLWRLRVNRAVVHTVPLTSCEACSQWEMNLQRMSPSDIQEMLHWSLLHCSRHTIVVLSTVPLMALIYLNAWKTFTFCLQQGKSVAVQGRKCVCAWEIVFYRQHLQSMNLRFVRLCNFLYSSRSLRKLQVLPCLTH